MILAKVAVRSEDSKIERPPGRSTVDAGNRPVIDRSLWPIATNAIGLFPRSIRTSRNPLSPF